jgi:outer membrane protein assembly factor BamB
MNHHGGMVLVNGHVYFGHAQNQGQPVCVEFKTGKIAWGPEDSPAGANQRAGSAGVLYADDRLYFRYQSGVMVLMEANPKEMKVVSQFTLPEPSGKQSWPHPVIANGRMYIRDQDKLHCFDVKATTN